MGLGYSRLLLGSFMGLLCAGVAYSQPQLRLSETTIGPVSVAQGTTGPAQTVEAFNAGDGALNLALASSEPWLVAAVGAPAPCTTRLGNCLPINMQLQTAGLPKGMATAILDVVDPNAIDAPQSITVTVQIGGGVPDQADFFVAPNGSSDSLLFSTNSQLSFNVSTNTGGNWLQMAFEGAGSFNFVMPYRIRARHLPGMAEGVHTGAVNITNSAFAPDVKNVPVTMTVTSQPIGALSTDRLFFRLAQDSVPLETFVDLVNRGLGTLALTGVEAATADGGTWLTVEQFGATNLSRIRLDAAGLPQGPHRGTVTIQSNAVNGPHVVDVLLLVEPQGPPRTSFQGVVNNATFEPEPVSPGDIVALFGDQLSYEPPTEGGVLPLPRQLGGASVFINGQESPLFFSSYGQINLQVPYEIQPGPARVQVVRDGQIGNVASLTIVPKAPRVLRFLGNFAIAVNQDGTFPVPSTPGLASRPARPGDVIVIFAIGFGQTSPAALTGEGASGDPLSQITPTPTVFLGGGLLRVPVTPQFVGLTPTFVGLYQINLQIPANAPRGPRVPLIIDQGGVISNQVEIAIE